MSVYLILTQDVLDADRYRNEYGANVIPLLHKFGAEVVVAEHEAQVLEGAPVAGVVVLRFPNEEALNEFYHCPEYQPIKAIRHAVTTNANAVIAPEFDLGARTAD